MIKYLPPSWREKARKVEWLARFYRKYIRRLPFDEVKVAKSDYSDEIIAKNDSALAGLPLTTIDGPLISILVPVYQPNLEHFNAMVQSVLAQSYPHWQLILVDDFSQQTELSTVLRDLAENSKIEVVYRTSNGHISLASNDGLAMAKGEFVALLDHDDLLHEHALKAVALTLSNNQSADILYSDEDKISASGKFEQPHYKPKWSLDLLLSHNYICHLGIYRRSLLDEIGGFRLGVEGSQDYDLVLRASKRTTPNKIIHIPYVLYHWRIAVGSTALAGSEKSYTDEAGLKALQDYFSDQQGVSVTNGMLSNTYKVNWPIPSPSPLVTIIIPTKNATNLVKQCIDSIYQYTDYTNFEILLVDNQSDDAESLAYFKQLEIERKVKLLIFDQPFNYSAINNYAASKAKGSILVLMNNDIEILNTHWLSEMVSQVARPEVGCVGAKLYYANHTIQHAGVVLGIGGVAGHAHKYFPEQHPGYFKRLQLIQNYSAVTAACLAVRKEVFDKVGGLNEAHLAIAFNDVDFCLKVREQGYNNVFTPYVEMIHHESVSRGAEDTLEKQARFNREVAYMQQRWNVELVNDPYYSPWLSLTHEDFSYR